MTGIYITVRGCSIALRMIPGESLIKEKQMLSACVSNSAHCVCCFPFHSVLYFSWHRYEHQKFWPHLRDSDYDIVGKEKGAGFNINVPWNKVRNTAHLWFHYGGFFYLLLALA